MFFVCLPECIPTIIRTGYPILSRNNVFTSRLQYLHLNYIQFYTPANQYVYPTYIPIISHYIPKIMVGCELSHEISHEPFQPAPSVVIHTLKKYPTGVLAVDFMNTMKQIVHVLEIPTTFALTETEKLHRAKLLRLGVISKPSTFKYKATISHRSERRICSVPSTFFWVFILNTFGSMRRPRYVSLAISCHHPPWRTLINTEKTAMSVSATFCLGSDGRELPGRCLPEVFHSHGGTPFYPIFGFSLINHPAIGVPPLMET